MLFHVTLIAETQSKQERLVRAFSPHADPLLVNMDVWVHD